MTMQEVLDRMEPIFQDVFDDASIRLTEHTSAKDVEGWDSLTHITLISSVEDEFHVRFPIKDLVKLKDVGALANLVLKYAK